MDETHAPSAENIMRAAHALRNGEVVGVPTETVYGLAANAYDQKAVQHIFEIKGRPSHNPLITHIASLDQLNLVGDPDSILRATNVLEKLRAFIPGPLSFVIKHNRKIADAVSAGLDTVAVRIPAHPVMQQILRHCDFPVAAPSANVSNYVSPTTALHVTEQFSNRIGIVIDGGQCVVGIESTIIDLSQETPRILRQGFVTAEQISDALTIPVDILLRKSASSNPEIIAPGMLKEHYSPRTPLARLSALPSLAPHSKLGLIYLNQTKPPHSGLKFEKKAALSTNGDFEEISHNLFKTMREFDTLGLDLIVVEECEPVGIGRAILDRITRASARSRREK